MYKLLALIFAGILAVVTAQPGLIATAPAINSYSYSTYGSALPYASGYYPLQYAAYNGYTGVVGYSGYKNVGPYNYYF